MQLSVIHEVLFISGLFHYGLGSPAFWAGEGVREHRFPVLWKIRAQLYFPVGAGRFASHPILLGLLVCSHRRYPNALFSIVAALADT